MSAACGDAMTTCTDSRPGYWYSATRSLRPQLQPGHDNRRARTGCRTARCGRSAVVCVLVKTGRLPACTVSITYQHRINHADVWAASSMGRGGQFAWHYVPQTRSRARVVVATLRDDQSKILVPATTGWTMNELLAHLVEVAPMRSTDGWTE